MLGKTTTPQKTGRNGRKLLCNCTSKLHTPHTPTRVIVQIHKAPLAAHKAETRRCNEPTLPAVQQCCMHKHIPPVMYLTVGHNWGKPRNPTRTAPPNHSIGMQQHSPVLQKQCAIPCTTWLQLHQTVVTSSVVVHNHVRSSCKQGHELGCMHPQRGALLAEPYRCTITGAAQLQCIPGCIS